MFAVLGAPASVVGFFSGTVSSLVKNHSILLGNQASEAAFLASVSALKESGMLNVLMGSGLAVVGMAGILGATMLVHNWGLHSLANGRLSRTDLFIGGLLGGAAAVATLSYGSYKIGDGLVEAGLALSASVLRR